MRTRTPMKSPPLKLDDDLCSIVPDSSLVPRGRACLSYKASLSHLLILSDEDISANVTPTSPPSTHIGPVTRARARQLNYQVLSFVANPSNVHEHMMLPKIDTFVLLMSEGPSMDKEDGHWSGIKHGRQGAHTGKENGASSGDFRTLKPP